jgi:hypothetical protein
MFAMIAGMVVTVATPLWMIVNSAGVLLQIIRSSARRSGPDARLHGRFL